MIKEKYRVLNKTFLSLKDIATLMDCGLSKASNYRKKYIKAKQLTSDYFQIQIPTADFIIFYKIDINLIRDNYVIEQKISGDIHA